MESKLLELEKQAYQGHIVEKGVTDNTLCYLTQIFHISWMYHMQQITKNELRQKRNALLRKYQARCKRESETKQLQQQCTAVCKEYQENIRLACQYLLDIERATDAEQIALLACKALGAMTGEATFYNRQAKKIENCKEKA